MFLKIIDKTMEDNDDFTKFEFPAITILLSSGICTAGVSGVVVVVVIGLVAEHLRGPLIVRSRKTLDENSAKVFSVS